MCMLPTALDAVLVFLNGAMFRQYEGAVGDCDMGEKRRTAILGKCWTKLSTAILIERK